MQGKLEIISIDDRNFGEWVEAEVAVDGVKCLPFQFTRRNWDKLRGNEAELHKYLYQFGKSVTEKCGTFANPLHMQQVEEAA